MKGGAIRTPGVCDWRISTIAGGMREDEEEARLLLILTFPLFLSFPPFEGDSEVKQWIVSSGHVLSVDGDLTGNGIFIVIDALT